MNESVWLQRTWSDALHFRQLQRFGGRFGVRDERRSDGVIFFRPLHPGKRISDLAHTVHVPG